MEKKGTKQDDENMDQKMDSSEENVAQIFCLYITVITYGC